MCLRNFVVFILCRCVSETLLCSNYIAVFQLICCVAVSSITLLCSSYVAVCFSYFFVLELSCCVFHLLCCVGITHKFVCREFYELKVAAVTPLLANYHHPCLTQ